MKKALAILLFFCLCICAQASEIHSKVLSNGMTVVAKHNSQNETVSLVCFVKTGSIHEGKYIGSGISHYLEHVVSSGSTKFRSEEEYLELHKTLDAEVNAFTSYDKTAYFQVVPPKHFSEALSILAEQMQFCLLDSAQVAREQQVISKEIIMGESEPLSKMFSSYRANTYNNTNLVYPILGYPELFLKLTRQDLLDYYQTRYVPNNMIFVVAGNIDPQMAIEQVEQAFAGFERKTLATIYQPSLAPLHSKHELIEEFGITQPWGMISQIIPASDIKDIHSLKAAADIFVNKDTAPLQKKLVQDLKLVRFVYAGTSNYPLLGMGDFSIYFEAADSKDIPKIKSIIYEELAKLSKQKVSAKHLQILFQKNEREKYLRLKDPLEESLYIGNSFFDYGTPDADEVKLDNLRRLTPADLNHAMTKYFHPEAKFTYIGVPLGQKQAIATATQGKVIKSELKEIVVNSELKIYHRQNISAPVVRGAIHLPISSMVETEHNHGTLSFMIDMMQQGTKKYPKDVWTDWFDDHAASLWGYINHDGIMIGFTCLKADLPQLQEMLIDAIKNPRFDEKEIALLKANRNMDYQRSKAFASRNHSDFRNLLTYQSPREQMDAEADNSIIQALNRTDILSAHKKYFRADKMTMAIVGDYDETESIALGQKLLSAMNRTPNSDPLHKPVLSLSNTTHTQEYPFEIAYVDITMAAPDINDPDHLVMFVIDAILNHGDLRIHKATRVNRDLVYYAYSYHVGYPGFGMLRFSSETSKEKIAELKDVLLNQIDMLINEDVSEDEIQGAIENMMQKTKNSITDEWLGYYAVGADTKGLGYDFYLKGAEKLRHITASDIRRVAGKYFRTRDITISIPSADVERIMPE